MQRSLIRAVIILVAALVILFLAVRYWIIQPIRCAPDCTGISLIAGNLRAYDLRGVRFIEATLLRTNFSGADLQGADFSGADLTDADLKNANLTDARLIGTNLSSADLRDAIFYDTNLSGARLDEADLTKTDLTKARLRGVILSGASLIEVDLRGSDLSGAELSRADLTGTDLSGANLSGASLSRADLSGANLTGVDLTGALLNLTNLTGVDLSGADLAGASLIGSNLSSATLSESVLAGAILVGAQLKGANLRSADLTDIKLFAAELTAADLAVDPILQELNQLQLSQLIKDADLSGIGYNRDTRWPLGKLVLLTDFLGEDYVQEISAALIAAEQAKTPAATAEAEASPTETPAGGEQRADQAGGAGRIDSPAPEVVIAGSNTVALLTQAINSLLAQERVDISVTIDGIGTGAGFQRYCVTGEADIAMASRPMTEEEREACLAIGRLPAPLPVGVDALTVVVNLGNGFLQDIAQEELATLFTAERWFNVNSEWPNDEIIHLLPSEQSGDLAFFVEQVFDGDVEPLRSAPNTTFVADQTELIRSLVSMPNAIGLLPHGIYRQNAEIVKLVTIAGATPDASGANQDQYALLRPLFLYTDADTMRKKPQVGEFLDFYLARVNEIIEQVGYLPISQSALDEARAALPLAQGDPLDPGQVEGSIVAAGSVVVSSLMQAAVERFVQAGFPGDVQLAETDTGAGFRLFCEQGQIDLALASRAIGDEEAAACAASGRQPVGLRIGADALAVVVNPANSFLTNVTLQELAAIFVADRWSDANPQWPEEEIVRFAPDTASEAVDLFTSRVFPDDAEPFLNAPNTLFSADDRQLIEGVANAPNAIGFLEYPLYQQDAASLQAVDVENVALDAETAERGEYALARPLLLYADPTIIGQKPQVAAFLLFYLAQADEIARQVGYLPASSDLLDQARTTVLTAVAGAAPAEEAAGEPAASEAQAEDAAANQANE